MKQYHYRACTTQGTIMRGTMSALHEAQLSLQLKDMGYELLSCHLPRHTQWRWRTAPDKKQMLLLFTQLAALAEAGVPLATCLADVWHSLPEGTLRDTLHMIMQAVQNGTDFATACAAHPRLFPHNLVRILQAGMAGGNLAQGFAKARDHLHWQDEFGTLLRRSTRYPLFLLGLTFAVISFMMLYVVPQLVDFLLAQNYALPWHSRALIWLAAQCGLLWWVLPLLIIAGIVLISSGRKTSPAFAAWVDGLMLRLPLVGTLIRQRECAHFLHHLALLVGGGVPIIPALQGASTTLNNRALHQQTTAMISAVTAGADLATVWQHTPAFAGLIARRAQIGLQTGTLAQQLEQASTECDHATLTQSKQLIGALEPALTLLVGALLSWIVLAVLGPLYGALGTLGAGR